MPVIVYKMVVSPPSRATLMVAELLGLKVQTRDVNLPARHHYKPEYLQKNPLHTVPLLEDDDLTLADSHAIITYLVSKYGSEDQQKLYPIDLRTRAIVDQLLYFDATILFPRLRTVIYSAVKRGAQSATKEQSADIIEAYDMLEKFLETTQFVAADYLTVADVSCVATVSSLNCVVPVDAKYVKLKEWWKRLEEEEWYKRENFPGLLLFDGFMKLFY